MRRTPFLDYINEQGLQFGFALIEDEDNVPFNFFYTSNLSVDREAMAAEPFDPAFPFAAWEDVEAGVPAGWPWPAAALPARGPRRARPPDRSGAVRRSGSTRGWDTRRSCSSGATRQLGPFLGMQNGKPPSAGGAGTRVLLWAQERLARALQGMPVRLPSLWEKTMRHHYIEGLRTGWVEGAGQDPGGAL